MKRSSLGSVVLLTILTACGSPPEPAAPAVEPPPPAPVATTPPPAPEPVKPPEPTAEEKKKAAEQQELQADRAKAEADSKAELARWTPEMHAEAKALADKTFATGKAATQAAMAGKHRKAGAADRDKYRHPVETLDFFGLKPTMTVLEIGPGDGWYTELLAPALAKKGKLELTSGDPNGPVESRSTFYAQRTKSFLDKAPELYGKVEVVTIDGKSPKLGADASLDMALIMRGAHGLHNSKTLGTWLSELHRTLKPNGVLGIEEHRAKADANPDESAKKGYLPEKWLIDQVEAAGFKLSAKSEINANPKDTKDYAECVWTLPPTFTLKDKDHDKYAAIGESDRMTLRFVNVAAKPAPKPAGGKDATKPSATPTPAPKPAAPMAVPPVKPN